jgi:hypothetical protein
LNGCSRNGREGRGSVQGFSGHIEIGLASVSGIEHLDLTARVRGEIVHGESISEPLTEFGRLIGYASRDTLTMDYTFRQRQRFTMTSAYLDILAEYHLPWSFLVKGGLSMGYRAIEPLYIRQDIVEPWGSRPVAWEELQGESAGYAAVCYRPYNKPWSESRGMSVGAIGQVGASISINDNVAVVPEAGVRWEMLPPVADNPWPTLELSAGLSIRYTFGDEP